MITEFRQRIFLDPTKTAGVIQPPLLETRTVDIVPTNHKKPNGKLDHHKHGRSSQNHNNTTPSKSTGVPNNQEG